MKPSLLVLALLALPACSSTSAAGDGEGAATDAAPATDAGAEATDDAGNAGDAGDDATTEAGDAGAAPTTFGGARPVTLRVPAGYDPAKPAPLVILLHGYGASGLVEDIGVTHVADEADAAGYFFAHPDGTNDKMGNRFWNATDGCCNFDGSQVDDVAYLTGLVKDISAAWSIDPKRVFFVGHSNGGFMSHRLACDASGLIAGIVSLAGATWKDQTKCNPDHPVAVLEVHGDADAVISYDGGTTAGGFGGPYPGAVETVTDWAKKNGCSLTPTTNAAALDLIPSLPGNETAVTTFSGCVAGGDVALWTMHGAVHTPGFGNGFGKAIWDGWFSKHAKP